MKATYGNQYTTCPGDYTVTVLNDELWWVGRRDDMTRIIDETQCPDGLETTFIGSSGKVTVRQDAQGTWIATSPPNGTNGPAGPLVLLSNRMRAAVRKELHQKGDA